MPPPMPPVTPDDEAAVRGFHDYMVRAGREVAGLFGLKPSNVPQLHPILVWFGLAAWRAGRAYERLVQARAARPHGHQGVQHASGVTPATAAPAAPAGRGDEWPDLPGPEDKTPVRLVDMSEEETYPGMPSGRGGRRG